MKNFECKIDHFSASFGGIFGLCLGGSVISLAELVYYFTTRLHYYYRLKHRKYNIHPGVSDYTKNILEEKYHERRQRLKSIYPDYKPDGHIRSRWTFNNDGLHIENRVLEELHNDVFLNEAARKDLRMYVTPRVYNITRPTN